MNIDQQWHDLDAQITRDIGADKTVRRMLEERRRPREYKKGDRVRRDLDGKVYTVKRSYWQNYAGDTSDWTIELDSIDPSQPTPWDKSTNLEPVTEGCHKASDVSTAYMKCPTCGAANEIVNQCGCDPNNMPTRVGGL